MSSELEVGERWGMWDELAGNAEREVLSHWEVLSCEF